MKLILCSSLFKFSLIFSLLLSYVEGGKKKPPPPTAEKTQAMFDYFYKIIDIGKYHEGYSSFNEPVLLEAEIPCRYHEILNIQCFGACFLNQLGIFKERYYKKQIGSSSGTMRLELIESELRRWLKLLFPQENEEYDDPVPAVENIVKGFWVCVSKFPMRIPKDYYGDCRGVQPILDCLVDVLMTKDGEPAEDYSDNGFDESDPTMGLLGNAADKKYNSALQLAEHAQSLGHSRRLMSMSRSNIFIEPEEGKIIEIPEVKDYSDSQVPEIPNTEDDDVLPRVDLDDGDDSVLG